MKNNKGNILKQKLAAAFIGFILLLLWLELSKYTVYSLVIPAVFLGFISWNSYTYAKAKKICLGKCYFSESSLFYYFWTRKTYIFIVALFIGLLLTASLVFASFTFNSIDIGILFLDTFILVYLYTFLENSKTFNAKVKRPILKNITAWVNSLFLVTVFFIIALYQTPPEYIQADLKSTLDFLNEKNYSKSQLIDTLAYASSVMVATKWWLVSKAEFLLENESLKKVIWFLQLMGSYMMVFAYSRFILEIVTTFTIQNEENGRE
jgi:hypothetical protein